MNSTIENPESPPKKNKPKNKIFLQVRDALKCCTEALSANPKNMMTLYNMGKCLIEQDNFSMAKDIMEKMKFLDSKNLYCSILDGHIKLREGNITESYKEFLRAYLNIQYNDPFLSYGMGLLYDMLENYKVARKWFTHLIKSDIELFKYLEVLYRIGVCYKKENRFSDAIEVFKSLENFIKTDLFRDDVRLQIAHIYEKMNDTEKCVNILNKLKTSKQITILVNRLYTWIYFKNNNYELIKNQFRCQKEGEISDKDVTFKSVHKELNFCDCPVRNESKDQYILYLLGRVFAAEKKYEDALETFLMCSRLDSGTYLALNSAGIINFRMKRYELALKFFQQALLVKSYYKEPLTNLQVTECVLRNVPTDLSIVESDPDIFLTRYLDSQVMFNECIFFVNIKDVYAIKELLPTRLEEFM
ncbi:hypothetical protein P3W45_000269 [Vairimorpha bombi]